MKILFWLEKDWAFGRIANAVKKYSRHQIDIVNWSRTATDCSTYDLIYTPEWVAGQLFNSWFNPTVPVCFSVHGLSELFHVNPVTLDTCVVDKQQVESGRISDKLKAVFNNQKIVGCVSREIFNLLRPQVDCALAYTPCGVDDEFFRPIQTMPLTVLCPVEEKQIGISSHGYSVKRWELIRDIQRQIDVSFKFLPKRLSNDEMSDWYRRGNVILNLSHSEGGPLGILEAGAGGAIPLSTPVGIVPEIIIPGFNGELLVGDPVEEAVRILKNWSTCDLLPMQSRIVDTMKSRHWRNVVESWDLFFDKAV